MPPTVGAALIAKDAAATIGATLASLRQFCTQIVVCVDSRSTDDTLAICQAAGAEVHRMRWQDHFARSRNEAFSYLDPALDWWFWCDADDVVQGAERVGAMLARIPAPFIGVWLPYDYAHLDDGTCYTSYTRERFLRPRIGWTWRHRVHEVVTPERDGPWTLCDDIRVVHQPHDASGSAPRNLRLLQMQYDLDDPAEYDRTRCLRELGDQHHALGDHATALEWYGRCIDAATNPIDLWWCWLKTSHCHRLLEDGASAKAAALNAFGMYPEWAESCLEMAHVSYGLGEYDQAIFFGELVPRATPTAHQVFRNPLDATVNWRLVVSAAYARQGLVDQARKALAPVRRHSAGTARDYREIGKACALKKQAETYIAANLENKAPPAPAADIGGLAAVRDLYVPRTLLRRGRPDITIFCGNGPEEWAPPKLDQGGIGGSETAVVEIARRFAADGLAVEVFTNPGKWEGAHDGVGYYEMRRFAPARVGKVFVAWRAPDARELGQAAETTLLWLHDLNAGSRLTRDASGFTRVLGVSAWHASYLQRLYPFLRDCAVDHVPNGIDPARFAGTEPRAVHRCLWSSSPDRGLDVLLALWPQIKARVDDAELHIFYGWDGVDRAIAAGRSDLAAFKAHIVDAVARLPGVVWRGRVGQQELAREQMAADCWTYPTTFVETSCITAMEMQAARTVPVVPKIGALTDTVGPAGLVLPGHAGSVRFQETYIGLVLAVLGDPHLRGQLQALGAARTAGFGWDASYAKWRAILAEAATPRAAVPA